ncbi:hypothetical protein [Thermus sp.]|uniref:hypothetical protein n=1 Tax=Thermus sp. TaxID=275 RepID=UPI0025E35FC4|nr:hypothetical protein [Thermus sp.]MCS6867806.1 hypothetical protein [Thermus sp.]MDW8358683.1 hypothetical protein [Thermus sp.]
MTLEQALLTLKRVREAFLAWDGGRLEAEEALVEVGEALEAAHLLEWGKEGQGKGASDNPLEG